MNLELLAGSVVFAGFAGTSVDEVPLDQLRDLAPGGLVLFARNVSTPEATAALCAELRSALTREDVAPLLAIDQEGGRVARLGRGFASFPSASALGAADDDALARGFGSALAAEVRRAGVEIDFAPVLDLLTEPASTVVGTRSLGADPLRVASLGANVVRGLQAGGVASVLKHFPGHGATALDSHLELPRIDAAAETLEARELLPFAAGIEAGALGVMAGHLLVPAIDPDRPASLSRLVLHDLLRERMGFRGVCFTDCLQMDAIARAPGTVEAAVEALAAGADALIVSHDLPVARAARDAIVAGVRSGRVPLERLEDARRRLLRLRERIAGLVDRAEIERDPGAVARRVAEMAIVALRGDLRLDPGRVVNVVSFEDGNADGVGSRNDGSGLHLLLRERRVRAESLRVPLDPANDVLETLDDVLSAQRDRRFVIVARRAHLHPAQARTIDALLEASPDAVLICGARALRRATFSAGEKRRVHLRRRRDDLCGLSRRSLGRASVRGASST